MDIPEEAFDAAFEAYYDNEYMGGPTACSAAIRAAAPFIAAKALEDAADEWEELPVNHGAEIKTGTWDWFELFPLHHVRERAEKIRGDD